MTGVRLKLAACLMVLAPIGATVALAEAASTPDAQAALERDGIIFERQQIMEQLGRDSELLGKIVAGTEPATKLPETTRAIATGAKESLEAFRSPLPGGRTKAEAWTNHGDFMQRLEAFARNADAMAVAGERKDMTGVMGLMVDALPCKQCHDVYRAPKAR